MKITLKNAFLALMIVLVSLCCVSCFDEDKPFVPQTTWQANPAGCMEYLSSRAPDEWVQITPSEGGKTLTVSYSTPKGITYDTITFKDATAGIFGATEYNSISTVESYQGDYIGSLAELLTYLPDTETWTIEFKSSTAPAEDFTHVVEAKYVTDIKAWMQLH